MITTGTSFMYRIRFNAYMKVRYYILISISIRWIRISIFIRIIYLSLTTRSKTSIYTRTSIYFCIWIIFCIGSRSIDIWCSIRINIRISSCPSFSFRISNRKQEPYDPCLWFPNYRSLTQTLSSTLSLTTFLRICSSHICRQRLNLSATYLFFRINYTGNQFSEPWIG